jgi:nitroimidazol reductase NimA-like FMN-containing flavoprotein (pyridoxamine 5'-phosphate oxidase superfamily)
MVGELTRSDIAEILSRNTFGRIACHDGTKPYIVPISFIAFDDYVLCHSRGGLKIDMMRKNPSVCFEVEEIENYTHWKTVIAWGNYEEITNSKETEDAAQHFADKMLNIKFNLSSPPPDAQEQNHDLMKPTSTELVVFKINFTELTGRFEQRPR